MNLLTISNTFPDFEDTYSVDIFVKEQVKYLRNYFENVYVICPTPFGIQLLRKTSHKDYEFENVHVYFPRYINCPLFYFHIRKIWIEQAKKAILKLIKAQGIGIDIIHAHYSWPSGAIAISLKEKLGIPVVITEHTSLTFKKMINKKHPIDLKTWKMADAIIRVNKFDIVKFESLGIPSEKLHYISNGFDSKKFYPMDKKYCRNKLDLPINKKIIINVGNLYSKVKGHDYLVDAMFSVIKIRNDAMIIVVGDGKLKKEIDEKIRSYGLEDYIILAGKRPHYEIPLWINAGDVFVLPSLDEGNPTVMFEALGCGIPFVGTKVGGIPDIIISDDHGLLCKSADSNDLAEKILTALDKEWDPKKISNYAKQFSWDNIAKKIFEVYMQKRHK